MRFNCCLLPFFYYFFIFFLLLFIFSLFLIFVFFVKLYKTQTNKYTLYVNSLLVYTAKIWHCTIWKHVLICEYLDCTLWRFLFIYLTSFLVEYDNFIIFLSFMCIQGIFFCCRRRLLDGCNGGLFFKRQLQYSSNECNRKIWCFSHFE